MRLLKALLHHSQYVGLSILVLVMLIWPAIEKVFGPQDKMIALGAAVGILLAFLAHFDQKLTSILNAGQEIHHASISEAFRLVLDRNKFHIKELRIYALTSEVILPVVRDLECSIDICRVMLHRFNESGRIKNSAQLNRMVEDLGERWQALKKEGKIKSLQVVLYDDIPTDYLIIIDDIAVIQGLYTPNDGSPHGNDFANPCIIFNGGVSSGRLVNKHRMWFDYWSKYWSDHQACDRQLKNIVSDVK